MIHDFDNVVKSFLFLFSSEDDVRKKKEAERRESTEANEENITILKKVKDHLFIAILCCSVNFFYKTLTHYQGAYFR